MIVQLSGTLLAVDDPTVMIDVNGVGYEIEMPTSCLMALPLIGEPITVHTHLVVREDAHHLFGFTVLEQRALFRALIRTSGVGPKLALTILSQMTPDDFVQCIRSEDLATIRKIKGIGQKVAERLVLEMRTHLAQWQLSRPASTTTPAQPTSLSQAVQDAISALQNLGFKANLAEQVITDLPDYAKRTSEELIRIALQKLA